MVRVRLGFVGVQVDHLLYCGADPFAKSGAGELPLEMVLLCGGTYKTTSGRQGWACRCMSSRDAEVRLLEAKSSLL